MCFGLELWELLGPVNGYGPATAGRVRPGTLSARARVYGIDWWVSRSTESVDCRKDKAVTFNGQANPKTLRQ